MAKKQRRNSQLAAYFEQRLGYESRRDWRHQPVGMTSKAGRACIRAIDAAAVLVESLRSEVGEDAGGECQQLGEITDDLCEQLVFGGNSDD